MMGCLRVLLLIGKGIPGYGKSLHALLFVELAFIIFCRLFAFDHFSLNPRHGLFPSTFYALGRVLGSIRGHIRWLEKWGWL